MGREDGGRAPKRPPARPPVSLDVQWGPHSATVGATTAILTPILRSALAAAAADIVILYSGVNDAFASKIPVASIVSNIRGHVEMVRNSSRRAKVLLAAPAGTWQWRKRLRKPGAPRVVEWRVRSIAEAIAAQRWPAAVTVVNASEGYQGVSFDPEKHTFDGVHPNAAGELLIAAAVWRALRPLLPPAGSSAAPRPVHGPLPGGDVPWLPPLKLDVQAAEQQAAAEERAQRAADSPEARQLPRAEWIVRRYKNVVK
eukprot:TRINITY_DN37183_c0_g1_i2.p1 TRINITY_DN37183_c0_g1~~TRINITY_DN37183_c0_g1_i2.p1  ORF type:complete len:256 (+),score=62.46 TRINITY_DN37183_c0_g1_i2:594-1361(+)